MINDIKQTLMTMMRKLQSTGLFFLFMACTLSCHARASENGDLPGLINERLSYMAEVATWKALNHQAIEIPEQEAKVMADALQIASEEGIEPLSIKPFIEVQISVAKAIQYRYRAGWLSLPQINTEHRSLKELRNLLAFSTKRIIARLALELKTNGHLSPTSQETFVARLHEKNLTNAEKMRLVRAIRLVHLKIPFLRSSDKQRRCGGLSPVDIQTRFQHDEVSLAESIAIMNFRTHHML